MGQLALTIVVIPWYKMKNKGVDGILTKSTMVVSLGLGAVLIKNYSSFEKYVRKVPRGFS